MSDRAFNFYFLNGQQVEMEEFMGGGGNVPVGAQFVPFQPPPALISQLVNNLISGQIAPRAPGAAPGPSGPNGAQGPNEESAFVQSVMNSFFGGANTVDSPFTQLLRSFDEMQQAWVEEQERKASIRPASKRAIANLDRFKWGSSEAGDAKDAACSVCMDEFKDGDEVYGIMCGHHFHTACLDPWFKEKNTCPTCRFELLTDNETWNVKIRENAKKRGLDLRESGPKLKKGDSVRIQGLTRATEHNGCTGVVLGPRNRKGRYPIQIGSRSTPFYLRPANLTPMRKQEKKCREKKCRHTQSSSSSSSSSSSASSSSSFGSRSQLSPPGGSRRTAPVTPSPSARPLAIMRCDTGAAARAADRAGRGRSSVGSQPLQVVTRSQSKREARQGRDSPASVERSRPATRRSSRSPAAGTRRRGQRQQPPLSPVRRTRRSKRQRAAAAEAESSRPKRQRSEGSSSRSSRRR